MFVDLRGAITMMFLETDRPRGIVTHFDMT
jgi:hypothetical protein